MARFNLKDESNVMVASSDGRPVISCNSSNADERVAIELKERQKKAQAGLCVSGFLANYFPSARGSMTCDYNNRVFLYDHDFAGLMSNDFFTKKISFIRCNFGNMEKNTYKLCTFFACDFSNCLITSSYFNDCKFIGCTFENSNFISSTFVSSVLFTGNRFDGARFREVVFLRSEINKQLLKPAIFSDAESPFKDSIKKANLENKYLPTGSFEMDRCRFTYCSMPYPASFQCDMKHSGMSCCSIDLMGHEGASSLLSSEKIFGVPVKGLLEIADENTNHDGKSSLAMKYLNRNNGDESYLRLEGNQIYGNKVDELSEKYGYMLVRQLAVIVDGLANHGFGPDNKLVTGDESDNVLYTFDYPEKKLKFLQSRFVCSPFISGIEEYQNNKFYPAILRDANNANTRSRMRMSRRISGYSEYSGLNSGDISSIDTIIYPQGKEIVFSDLKLFLSRFNSPQDVEYLMPEERGIYKPVKAPPVPNLPASPNSSPELESRPVISAISGGLFECVVNTSNGPITIEYTDQ